MIKIIRWRPALDEPELFCPAFFCDVCGEHIDNVSMALYFWQTDAETGEPVSDVITVHKACNRRIVEQPGTLLMCIELHELFDQLRKNARPISLWDDDDAATEQG
jgi:hypothetical protein